MTDVTGVTGVTFEELDAVRWELLEPATEFHPPGETKRALRRLVRRGDAATEEDCHPLFECFGLGRGRVPSVATAALPFVVRLALARHPDRGARAALVELLAGAQKEAAGADPALVDAGWHAAWRLQRPRFPALLADPAPEVRREALALAEDADALLERWRAETDPTVRLPLLLALGGAAAASGEAGAVDRVRETVTGVLRTGDPVMRVAAVYAWAAFDPDAPVREQDLLVDVLSDPAVRPRFETVWYLPAVEDAFGRESVVSWAVSLLGHAPETALSFCVRLIGAAREHGDPLLCRTALDEAWRLLVVRPSVAAALLPLAGALLADPDDGVRYRAAHLLAVLGPEAAPYADGLAALLDDPGEEEYLEGTVGDHARWALNRIGDPRGLPDLVERLYAPYRDRYSRAYVLGDPRLPEIEEVLIPLREHAQTLLPAVRELLRDPGADGPLTRCFLEVLQAWGPAAAPALPEVVPLLEDSCLSLSAIDALVAMGPAAAPAAPAVRGAVVLDHPANHLKVAWALWRLGGDHGEALRLVGEAVPRVDGPGYGPVHLLGTFGPAAAPYADGVRHVMEHGGPWLRPRAAVALWRITGDPEPSASVLEADLFPVAEGGDSYGPFLDALHALADIGTLSPAARAALHAVRESDRRLAGYRDHRAFLQDERIRSAIDAVLARSEGPRDASRTVR
ncbi:hypothetical protein ACFFSH_24575 [Streptomyces filamentosus]|uniref:HEAT repeat domain-containing protein n=1 Tax=Streptomyces filamentosus TaxID=67294 RepID=UPI0016747E67|nr:hypothetical protein [Streptomyces filamentosus]